MNVTICSRKAAEELLRTDALSHTAVISFCDPPSTDRPAPTPPLDYTGAAARVFTVAVRDLDLSVLPDVGLTYDTYLLEADPELPLRIKEDENSEIGWIGVEEIERRSTEKWFVERIYSKLCKKAQSLRNGKLAILE